jgi:hypothetical protein
MRDGRFANYSFLCENWEISALFAKISGPIRRMSAKFSRYYRAKLAQRNLKA